MSKQNNLTDFLTGVADAIRAKKGTTALINPQNFESEIGSISTAKEGQEKSVTITENGTTEVLPDDGYDGLDKVTINVQVSPTIQEKRVSPTTEAQEVVPDTGYDGLSKVTIAPVTSAIDANIKADNIKAGVTILGVTGTQQGYITVASVEELNNTTAADDTLAIVEGE